MKQTKFRNNKVINRLSGCFFSIAFRKVLIIVMIFVFVPGFAIAAGKMPRIVGLITYSAGSKMYAITTGMAHAIQKHSGINVRVVPGGTNRAKALAIINKEVVLGVGFENAWYGIQGGVWDFAKDGPQDLQMAWLGSVGCTTIVWRKDSGIKSVKDLRGKRVGYYGDYDAGSNMLVTGILAFGGLTWDDVKPVSTTYGQGIQLLLDGKVDAAYNSPASSKVRELAATIHGVMIAELPAYNVEGWKKVMKVCPVVGPGKVAIGYGASKANPREWPTYASYLMTRSDADPELIKTLIKAMIEGYDDYKGTHPDAVDWNVKNALDLNVLKMTGWSYHPGSIKAFKDLGLWTEKHQEWQDSRVEFSKLLKRTYKKTVQDAKAKNIEVGCPAFEKMWAPRWKEIRVALNQ